MTLSPLQRLLPAALSIALLGLTACESSRRAHVAAQLEEERKSVPPMEGKDTFFDGHLTAFVSLGSGLAGLPVPARGPGRDSIPNSSASKPAGATTAFTRPSPG